MKLYLAGPMSGIKHFNYPAFADAALRLRLAGHEVFSPAENDIKNGMDLTKFNGSEILRDHGFSLREILKQDLAWICDHAEGIALLPNWQNSRGAVAEVALAKALGIDYRPVEWWVEDALTVPEETISFEPGLGYVIEEVTNA